MIKISALNTLSEEESGSEEEVTREALEQIALQQYAKALELERKGNPKDATQLLKDLLDTELLDEVKTPAQGEKVSGPLLKLKYLCYKNLGTMLSKAGETKDAIDAFCAASELDDTDITLWHKLGRLCMVKNDYEMALHAFQRGLDHNPRYWPCLDKNILLLLGLNYKEECIVAIHDALQLDPGYFRGLVYKRHIYKTFPYVKDYMEYLNPIYKWDEKDDDPIDEEKATKFLQEANEIQETYLEQLKADKFKHTLPLLKLKKPISELTWTSVGESLVQMHHYMADNYFSHACFIELIFHEEEKVQPMEICEEPKEIEPVESKPEEINSEPEKKEDQNVSENENNDMSDKDKAATDTEKATTDNEKVESDVEVINTAGVPTETKTQKKAPVRRRGSALSFLQQWEWCNKRRSGRKKPANRQNADDNIYDTLRRMVPFVLSPDMVQKKENQARDTSPDTTYIDKLFNENEQEPKEVEQYFGTENENKDVKEFIAKYTENKKDMIDLLKDYLNILSQKWSLKWPDDLPKIFIEANKCYNLHIDIPACTDDKKEEMLHYTMVNILVEEFSVNEKLISENNTNDNHDLSVIESIGIILSLSPHVFTGSHCLELTLRYNWVKICIHILNKCEEFALDSLYNILYEFESMGEECDTFSLSLPNFSFKPVINVSEILDSIKFLERNKKLSTVMELYDHGNYEEVLTIVIDSFEYCKTIAKKQEDEMSLDFAVQLSLILDTYWALDKVEECFKWALICLHEALKHYFRVTSGSQDYEKWTLTVVKILCCMEHILSTEGLTCLDSVSEKELSQGLEDLIRIIGHQVETNASEMPLNTVVPWIIMHYILQREDDQGRSRPFDKDKVACDEIPNPLLVLFIGHEQLGTRGWCCNSEGKLLYFILDTVVPRLRSPSLAKCLEQITQYMEQCVYCLFGHPGRKNKLKYLVDHNAKAHTLDWKRAMQLYEIFRPPILPALEGKIPGITADTEQLFRRILDLLPPECDPQKYVPEIEKYIKGIEENLPAITPTLPYKLKDIYFLLGDYYFKKEEGKMAVKYNMLDVVVNNDRLESWAEISLAKAFNLERLLNSCKNLNNEREYLNPAKAIIRCFKRALELDPSHCTLRVEYGVFVYTVHSFCSRLLKQASESFSMEDFEALEKQREDMLDTTQKCFFTVWNDLSNSNVGEKENEDMWLHYYMLGKVSEKRNKPPSVYLEYYMKGVKSLQDTDATYPLKINYSSPTQLCIEVLELHYRIHASILKYIEQHENKPIPVSVGKAFTHCIETWKNGPFFKKSKKDGATESENEQNRPKEPSIQAANILKRSVSDSGEDDTHEIKRLKMEAAAAKVRRSASYDTERLNKQPTVTNNEALNIQEVPKLVAPAPEKKPEPSPKPQVENEQRQETEAKNPEETVSEVQDKVEEKKQDTDGEKKEESSSVSSSGSSSESSSSDSSSDSSSESSRDSEESVKSNHDSEPITEEEIMKIIAACLDALEDCTSRFPQHYKAIYRLAHYHFYSKRGKNIERCRDLMLSSFISRSGQKLAGLFSERKSSNFFNNIWKIPLCEVDRAGSFPFHMGRSVQLTMEILKEIDDHKTLLDLSLQLQRIPEPDKTYLRDSDREELAHQAFTLCIQSLKGQLTKFSQQADLQSNDVERQALKSLMLDIYRAYLRAQKQPNSKQFTNLLVEGYKLVAIETKPDTVNLVDVSMKYCQKLIQKLKHEATLASLDKSQNAQKKQAAKFVEAAKPPPPPVPSVSTAKPDYKAPTTTASASGLPKISPNDMAAAFHSYLPMLSDPISSQTAAAISFLSNMAMAGYQHFPNTLQPSLQNSLQSSFQAEFYRQFLEKSFAPYMPPAKKQKRGPKPQQPSVRPPVNIQVKPNQVKSYPTSMTNVSKSSPASAITSSQKPSITPSMGTVLSSLPASMSANLTSFSGHASHSSGNSSLPAQAHMTSTSTVNAAIHTKPPMPHQQVSPGKTLQEKLAEKQKNLPLSKTAQEISASISKLPSSLTITKTSVPKSGQAKKPDAKKTLPFSIPERPKPITTDEVIVLDDD